ncbi:MAG: TIGR03016 family PEP-CTERM system-associated outer membrane protein [Pseudomonadota bacterium]
MTNIQNIALLPITALVVALPITAAELNTDLGVAAELTYTDNVCLSDDDTEDDWIASVTPNGSISSSGGGSRVNYNLSGSVRINSLANSDLRDKCGGGGFDNREQFLPQLNGNVNAELIQNWFFLDGAVRVSQNEVSPFVSGGDDPFDRTGNTNTTYDYTVSPYISRRFKDFALLNIRYVWNDQYNTADIVGDSEQERASASLSSVPGTARLSWGLQGNYSKTKFDDNDFVDPVNNQTELSSAQLNLGFQLTRSWQVNGFVGQEWNDFVSSRDDIDGTFWDVGVRWTPNSRIEVNAGIGERFFGNNPRFSMIYRHKRSAFTASYAKTLTYSRDIRTEPEAPEVNPDFPPPPNIGQDVTTITNNPILDERFTLGYSFQGRLTSFGISAFQSEQIQEEQSAVNTLRDAIYRGVVLSGSRSLSNLTSLNALIGWSEVEPKEDSGGGNVPLQDESETWRGSLGLNHRLGLRTSIGVRYTYTDRQSELGFNSYKENRVTLTLRVSF